MASRAPAPAPAPGKGKKVTLATVLGVAVAAALGQAIPQEESGRKVEATVNSAGELGVRHISGKQYLKAYLDIVGVPTACDGITSYRGRKVKIGDTFTEAQCSAMLEEELLTHAIKVMDCTPGLHLSPAPVLERQRQGPRFAAVSVAYNVGTGAYCGSTAKKRFNAGDYDGGCTALTWFNRAGGKVNRGLVARRGHENKVCVGGLAAMRNY